MTVKAATTYTPTTADQTIAAGIYLTGKQTIKGDTNLVAGNIVSGITIFGVTGTYAGNTDLASGFSLDVSSVSGDTAVTVQSLSNGYYDVIANNLSVNATLRASAPGYFSSGSGNANNINNMKIGKIQAAQITVSGTKTAALPTIGKYTTAISNAIPINNGTITTAVPTSGIYYIAMRATAPATTITLNSTIDQIGYLNTIAQVSTTAYTTTSSRTYYLKIPKATFKDNESYIETNISISPGTFNLINSEQQLSGGKTRINVSPTAATAINEPYYISVQASVDTTSTNVWRGSNDCTIQLDSAGYVSENFILKLDNYITTTSTSASRNFYIPIPKAQLGVSTTATVTDVNITTGDNISFHNDPDAYAEVEGFTGHFGYVPLTMTAIGAVTATVSTTAGYIETGEINTSTTVTMGITRYINSVTVPPGYHFVINVPNGDQYISFRFSVSSNGAVYIDSP